jgi:hypothetical protein
LHFNEIKEIKILKNLLFFALSYSAAVILHDAQWYGVGSGFKGKKKQDDTSN